MSNTIYVHIGFIIPTEPPKLEYKGYFNDPDEAILLDNDMDCYKAFLDDINQNGVKYCLCVDSQGYIRDGNCRYWCLRRLGIQWVPIRMDFFLGNSRQFYPKVEVQFQIDSLCCNHYV